MWAAGERVFAVVRLPALHSPPNVTISCAPGLLASPACSLPGAALDTPPGSFRVLSSFPAEAETRPFLWEPLWAPWRGQALHWAFQLLLTVVLTAVRQSTSPLVWAPLGLSPSRLAKVQGGTLSV